MNEVVMRIDAIADDLRAGDRESTGLRCYPEKQMRQLVETGVFKILQIKEFGGYEGTLREFLEAVMQVGHYSPSAGWIAGVVGVHPWEFSLVNRQLQEEIWGEDTDTLVASPYAPFGRARPAEGGVIFNGRWPYSTGTDHCDWIILGGFLTDENGDIGAVPQLRHFVLPRGDYEIVEDSWHVVGLQGTGSRDVVVRDAFIPDHRVIDPAGLFDATTPKVLGCTSLTYYISFGVVFSLAIASGTIGIAEGALKAFTDYTKSRMSVAGFKISKDPFQLAALGEAMADIASSRETLLDAADWALEILKTQDCLTVDQRLAVRSKQVRASRRAVDAVDRLFAHAGAGSLNLDHPLQAFWRDLHAGMNHICNVAEPIYQGYGLNLFGEELPPGLFI
jgi:alkylation response protein AidB-like acyl-CoA dehydrogenase